MMKTEYFVSSQRTHTELRAAIIEAETARDSFLSKIGDNIEGVNKEELKVVTTGANNLLICVIIEFSYYLKDGY